jgi:hypothetical protein
MLRLASVYVNFGPSTYRFLLFLLAECRHSSFQCIGGGDLGTELKIKDGGELRTGEIRNRRDHVLHVMGPVALGKRVHMRGNFERSEGATHSLQEGPELKPPKPEGHYLLFGHDTAVCDHLPAVKSYRNISAATVNSDAIN